MLSSSENIYCIVNALVTAGFFENCSVILRHSFAEHP